MATAKQLAARRLFAKRSKAGTLRKGTRKTKSRSRATTKRTTTRRKSSVRTMKRKTYRRKSSGMKIGKPMLKGTLAAVMLGVGAAAVADRIVPGNPIAKYGAALAGGGFAGVGGVIAVDMIGGNNPLTGITSRASRIAGQYGSGGY